jgi:hypothetical protein
MSALPLPAPIPPLSLMRWQLGIARLSDCGVKHIEHARILFPACDMAKAPVHLRRILPCQLRHIADAEHFEISQHSWPDRNQVG